MIIYHFNKIPKQGLFTSVEIRSNRSPTALNFGVTDKDAGHEIIVPLGCIRLAARPTRGHRLGSLPAPGVQSSCETQAWSVNPTGSGL